MAGTFYARESLTVLYNFVREALREDWLPFELLGPGGLKLTDENLAFNECGLVSKKAGPSTGVFRVSESAAAPNLGMLVSSVGSWALAEIHTWQEPGLGTRTTCCGVKVHHHCSSVTLLFLSQVPSALLTLAWDTAVMADIQAAGEEQPASPLKPELLSRVQTLS